MKKKDLQPELFKEFEGAAKKRRMTSGILPRNYVLFNVSYEQIIFVTIGLIMLMVLLFSLGVERGKNLAAGSGEARPALVDEAPARPFEEAPPAPEETPAPVEAFLEAPPAPEEVVAESEAAAALQEGAAEARQKKAYTIQVISYRSKRSAQEEIARLTKKGFSPFIIPGGGYYQICVGEYSGNSEAKSDLSKLRKSYRDSFLRKR